MTSRERILQAVKANLPPAVSRPPEPEASAADSAEGLAEPSAASVQAGAEGLVERSVASHKPGAEGLVERPVVAVPAEAGPGADGLFERFSVALRAAAGTCERVRRADVERVVAERFPDARSIGSTYRGMARAAVVPTPDTSREVLASVDVMVCPGVLGVAENGAVWVTESQMGHRAAPFLAEHLVLVVPVDGLVVDLEEAYRRIRIDEEGFGVWIAGPSKTADIEQSLVIGAHGPRSVLVLVLTG